MTEQFVTGAAWAGLAVLAFLCLPLGCCQRLVLGLTTWALRLALLAILGGGAYLYFRPTEMPPAVTDTLDRFPAVLTILPERSAPHFGLCLAGLVVAPLVPVLMMLDVTRALAGRRLRRLTNMADGWVEVVSAPTPARRPAADAVPVAEVPPVTTGVPVLRPVDRRTATATLASAGTRSRIPVAPR